MADEQRMFITWDDIKNNIESVPDNIDEIKLATQINDGIMKAYILYLAFAW